MSLDLLSRCSLGEGVSTPVQCSFFNPQSTIRNPQSATPAPIAFLSRKKPNTPNHPKSSQAIPNTRVAGIELAIGPRLGEEYPSCASRQTWQGGVAAPPKLWRPQTSIQPTRCARAFPPAGRPRQGASLRSRRNSCPDAAPKASGAAGLPTVPVGVRIPHLASCISYLEFFHHLSRLHPTKGGGTTTVQPPRRIFTI